MKYCLVHKIQTPDGTILHSKTNWDYCSYKDANGDVYMTDGLGYSVRRSFNAVPATDLSVWFDPDNIELTEEVRTAKFWTTYGKLGNEPKKQISLSEMTYEHLCAIIETQQQIKGTAIGKLFEAEKQFRNS